MRITSELSLDGLSSKCAFMTAHLWVIGLLRMEQSLSMAILLNCLTPCGHYPLQHDASFTEAAVVDGFVLLYKK